jgi:hypothetical protein
MLRYDNVERETAVRDPLGIVMIVGDYGGFTYVIRRASDVVADENTLARLAIDLDAAFGLIYHEAAGVHWRVCNPWSEWDGTPPVSTGFWMNPELIDKGISPPAVEAVLSGMTPYLIPA